MTDMNKDVSTHHHLRDVSVDCACLRGSIHRRPCLRVSETCHVSLFRWTAFHAFFCSQNVYTGNINRDAEFLGRFRLRLTGTRPHGMYSY